MSDESLLAYANGRLAGLRSRRYSWWAHWRELASYFLPRRYRWLVATNTADRGSPINQYILDSSAVIYARNLASGLVSGKSSPTTPWFRIKIGRQDSTKTSPVSLWLSAVEQLLYLVFSESNFYNSIAVFYLDLVIFGTAAMLIYEDYENVITCVNPCLGEYYVDIDANYAPTIFYREFTKTVDQLVREFGRDNCSEAVRALYDQPNGSGLSLEFIVGHFIEPNDDGRGPEFGFGSSVKFREVYWELGAVSPSQAVGRSGSILRRRSFTESPAIICRWDLASNDAYGRSPGMDALGDQRQLQLESRRKAQAIDKMVNPPMVADVQMKNQPANLTPGGVTYVPGFSASGKAGFASVFDTPFNVDHITKDLAEVRARLAAIFFNDVLKVASQYETRSNVTAVEWDLRKSESLIMLGPALERIDFEALRPIIDRVFAMAGRAGILPPAPREIHGQMMNIDFVSMLAQAQAATKAASIERVLSLCGNLVGVDPSAMDNIDVDTALDIYSSLLNNDPRMIRSPEALAEIRKQRAQAQAQAAQADQAQKLSAGAANLSKADVGGGQNALQAVMGGQQ